ncbi:hypothetical protein OF83DRAFT_1174855 [Amylostereum chailletii]|nr:hypothetical protein OF83DRAFT_1174855 [Amylostereum chailletii]
MASQALAFTALSQTGSPEFLHVYPAPLPPLGPSQVKIEFVVSPINIQDILVLAGKYPVKPATKVGDENAQVPGYEGVAIVLEVGSGVAALHVGDHVLPKEHGLGTWRTHAVVDASALVRIPHPQDPVFASLLKMGYTPAYLLLRNMRYLKPGDWVIQNAATGTIAQALVQFARLMGVRTVSVVRDREDVGAAKARLRGLGVDVVLSESEMEALEQPLSASRRIVLAVDSVFGASGTRIANQLVAGGTYVSLGFLGGPGRPLDVTEALLFYRAIEFKGFRTSKELAAWGEGERADLWAWMLELHERGELKAPEYEVTEWAVGGDEGVLEGALVKAVERARGKEVGIPKQVIMFRRS